MKSHFLHGWYACGQGFVNLCHLVINLITNLHKLTQIYTKYTQSTRKSMFGTCDFITYLDELGHAESKTHVCSLGHFPGPKALWDLKMTPWSIKNSHGGTNDKG